jgi:D-alanine transaminase
MSRIAYVNGRYRPLAAAEIPAEDRGYLFADGAYEVIAVIDRRCVDLAPHLDRLERSLGELRIRPPRSRAALELVLAETLRRNGLRDAKLYIQVTRGTAPRDQAFPAAARPSLLVTVRALRPTPARDREQGVAVVTRPDIRWQRCDIKSVALLPNVLARQEAAEAGCREAWLLAPDGQVREGSTSNAWIVDAGSVVRTHPADRRILGGITRRAVIDLARRERIEVHEEAFTREEALAAREAFLTSTTSGVLPVVRVDGAPVGEGRPGPVTQRLQALYDAYAGLPLRA